MISKKDLVYRMDDMCDEINSLCLRVLALERRELKKDLKKLTKKTPGKRGPGRPRKESKDGAKK